MTAAIASAVRHSAPVVVPADLLDHRGELTLDRHADGDRADQRRHGEVGYQPARVRDAERAAVRHQLVAPDHLAEAPARGARLHHARRLLADRGLHFEGTPDEQEAQLAALLDHRAARAARHRPARVQVRYEFDTGRSGQTRHARRRPRRGRRVP
jgi:hypothetical protein